MDLQEFLTQTQNDVQMEINNRIVAADQNYPYAELVFTNIVMNYMAEIGMTNEPVECHFHARGRNNAILRLSGYSISDEFDQLDLFVSIYKGADKLIRITNSEAKKVAEQSLKFFQHCCTGKMSEKVDVANESYELILTLEGSYKKLDSVRIFVITDAVSEAKRFKNREEQGITISLEVMDIERLFRHWAEGKPRDELLIDFKEISGNILPCVYVPGEMEEYDYALTAIPGNTLRFAYEKYGPRLLESNVRSFLSVTGKVNRGIRDTLREQPERFMAYNNGIVLTVDEAHIERTDDGIPGLSWVKGMQIVNGGQTTASLYFTKKKYKDTDLSRVRVSAKVIILNIDDPEKEEKLIADISNYANSQNSVRRSDLQSNKPYHIEIEKLANSIVCPDGVGLWFYERSTGSYKTKLTKEGTTPVKLKRLKKDIIPTWRKVTKTDLAKFLNSWEQNPHIVSLGAQKNFLKYMDEIMDENGNLKIEKPDADEFKKMIVKTILFKKTLPKIRQDFSTVNSPHNITIYLISVFSMLYGDKFNFKKVWLEQDISDRLLSQLRKWAIDVNNTIQKSSEGKLISEWAKKEDCWIAVKNRPYAKIEDSIPEIIYEY